MALLVEHGIFSDEKAAAIRREGERVIVRLEANEAPFCEPWHEWQPDPSWGVPVLPPEWDEVARVT